MPPIFQTHCVSYRIRVRDRNGKQHIFYAVANGPTVGSLVRGLTGRQVRPPCHPSNLAAVCASIYHTIHTLTLTLTLILTLSPTLNFTLISSYLTNKNQYAQPNWMTSRLRDQSAARCKNCRPVPIGYTDNSLECADLSVRAILTITLTVANSVTNNT